MHGSGRLLWKVVHANLSLRHYRRRKYTQGSNNKVDALDASCTSSLTMDSVSDRETDNIRTDKIVDIPLVSADVSEEEGELLFIAETIVETFLEDDAQYLNAALNIRRQTFILGSATLEEDRVLHYLREQESTGLALANFLRWKLNEFRNDDASVPNNLQPFLSSVDWILQSAKTPSEWSPEKSKSELVAVLVIIVASLRCSGFDVSLVPKRFFVAYLMRAVLLQHKKRDLFVDLLTGLGFPKQFIKDVKKKDAFELKQFVSQVAVAKLFGVDVVDLGQDLADIVRYCAIEERARINIGASVHATIKHIIKKRFCPNVEWEADPGSERAPASVSDIAAMLVRTAKDDK